jgi:hypothetical protein
VYVNLMNEIYLSWYKYFIYDKFFL